MMKLLMALPFISVLVSMFRLPKRTPSLVLVKAFSTTTTTTTRRLPLLMHRERRIRRLCLASCPSSSARSSSSSSYSFMTLRMATTAASSGTASTNKQKHHNELDVSQVILKRNQQSKAFRNGNQLVFTRAIQQTKTTAGAASAEPALAELVQVLVQDSTQPVALGFGVYNPHSLYRVRILCHRFLQPQLYAAVAASTNPTNALQVILRHHVQQAVATRRALHLPQPACTDTYRLVNGEGDHLSGLAVDVINATTVVVMSSAAWCQIHQATILEALQQALPTPGTDIIWKSTPSRLVQDGYNQTSEQEALVKGEEAATLHKANHEVISTENGIKYKTYPYSDGQKTGVYCDQRENRWNLAQLCRDKRVLDLCCFHGGFSLNALINGGAKSCIGVDSSQDAIDTCRANAQLNGYDDSDERIQFVRSDITMFLQDSAASQEKDPIYYDVIVLDPPKLAPSAAGLDKARRKYHAFNRDAIKLICPTQGGLLLTCTCSAAMTQKDAGQYFLSMVQGAAQAAGRHVTLLRVSGAASCHVQSPVSWPAGAYLTAALFYVHAVE